MDDLPADLRERLEREKLAALYQFAYGLSHEINNPLANISARAQTLLASEKDSDRRRMLATIHAQALRAHEMIADLMLFARPPEPRKETIDLAALARQAVGEWKITAESQGTDLCLEAVEPISLRADPQQLAVALGAVIRNALEALGRGGRVNVILSRSPTGETSVAITDTGPGISPDARRHMFDPYYSGREAGRGLGLGLSKCWRIVELHGGRIEVESPESGGATVRLVLGPEAGSR